MPLGFKIPVLTQSYVNSFPDVFVLAECEYGSYVDTWLQHGRGDLISETAVVALDYMWQHTIQILCKVNLYFNQCDESSQIRLRPDFVAMSVESMLVMKGEAKASSLDLSVAMGGLIKKLHSRAHKLFPQGCNSIPGIVTSNSKACLRVISYSSKQFEQRHVKVYNLLSLMDRVDFIVDIFNICRWIASQVNPQEPFHLVPGIRMKTRNNNHVIWMEDGIEKEFSASRAVPLETIAAIYSHKLPNIEHGRVDLKKIIITRIGATLPVALATRRLDKLAAFEQVKRGVEQLHSIGYAHCDICIDNIFVDDDNIVFVGDLEYCCPIDGPPPVGIKRSSECAHTAGQLDEIQLERLKNEL